MSKPGDFSSKTYSPSSSGPAKSLPNIQSKKDDMVGLNDKFVQLIDKVKNLEDEKTKLETKLKILKGQEDYQGKIDDIVRQAENELEQMIEDLLHDQEKLQAELDNKLAEKDDIKNRYEDEVKKKEDLEKDFVIAKKDEGDAHMEEVDLVLELEDLMGKLDFRRAGYDEEIKELQSQIHSKTVTITDNNKRDLDMDDIILKVKNQYASMASRSREEAEQWHHRKFSDLVLKTEQREQDVRDLRRDIADIQRHIQRLNAEIDALIRKVDSLRKEINDTGAEGDKNLDNARVDIAQLEEALRQAKQELAKQIREHQELMNIKLALDIEIITYRKLLEGEEQRMDNFMRQADVHLPLKQYQPSKQHLPSKPEKSQAPESTTVPPVTTIPTDNIIPAMCPTSKKRLLIRVEVEAGRVVSTAYTVE